MCTVTHSEVNSPSDDYLLLLVHAVMSVFGYYGFLSANKDMLYIFNLNIFYAKMQQMGLVPGERTALSEIPSWIKKN